MGGQCVQQERAFQIVLADDGECLLPIDAVGVAIEDAGELGDLPQIECPSVVATDMMNLGMKESIDQLQVNIDRRRTVEPAIFGERVLHRLVDVATK